MSLTDKVIVVTGATGGIGPSVGAALLADGAQVAITGQRPERVALALEQLGAGSRVDGRAVALTDERQALAFADWVADRFGGIDGLVAVAGGFAGGSPVHETDLATWQGQQDINLTTAFLSCKAVIPHLIRRGGGSIVTVASRPALHGTPSLAAYSVAKSGVLRLTEALAEELKSSSINANAILPSVIDTPANRASSPNADYSRWVTPDAIAAVVRWLLGPEARIISGAAIPVYGRS